MDFKGKNILITGASRGIGRACAQLCADLGARVAIHFGSNHLEALHTQNSLTGDGHIIVQADLKDAQAIRIAVHTVVERFDRIDVLINNAGVFAEQPVDSVSYETWRDGWEKTLSTNLIGTANITYCVARHMIQNNIHGKIINISSRTAFRGKPEAPAYVASKAGLNSLTQSLAYALAPHNIHVYAIAPGVVDTDMASEDKTSPAWESIKQQSPLGRVCTPEEVAHTATFLASNQTAYLTGGIIDLFGASYFRT